MKRLSQIIILTLLFVSVKPAHALFFDVENDHPYAEAIDYLTREGILKGYENRSFQPERAVNRAEFTKILTMMFYPQSFIDSCLDADPLEVLQIPELHFPDVPHDSWFAPYVCAAWFNGVISGYPDGTFKPEEGVNFAEAAKMMSIALGLSGIELPNLGAEANAIWYLPYVRILADRGVIPMSITDVGLPLRRAEMAEIIYRLRDEASGIEPVPELTRTYDELTSPIVWHHYRDLENRFEIEYPNLWPEPHMQERGVFDALAPYETSSWRTYFGPEPEKCFGAGVCAERDITLDAYEIRFLDFSLDRLEIDENVTIVSESENEEMYKVVYDEWSPKDGPSAKGCTSKSALLVRPLDTPKYHNNYFFRLRFLCAADDDDRTHTFRRILQSFEFMPLY